MSSKFIMFSRGILVKMWLD